MRTASTRRQIRCGRNWKENGDMVVIILESVPPTLRGELTRWLIEPHPGTFVGRVSAMVRERLWMKCCRARRDGGVIMIWSTNNEQGFSMLMQGYTRRRLVDYEGLLLICKP